MDPRTKTFELPFQRDMKLGRSYDIQNLRAGIDFLPKSNLSNPVSTPLDNTSVNYCVIKSSKDIVNMLGMNPAVALKVKVGILKAGPGGQYLSEYKPEDNVYEILIRVSHETEKLSLNETHSESEAAGTKTIGSHFIVSVIHGGELLFRLRLRDINSAEEKELEESLNAEDIPSFLQRFEKRSTDRIEISTYSDQDMRTPSNIESVLETTGKFKYLVGHSGIPLRCELLPLTSPVCSRDIASGETLVTQPSFGPQALQPAVIISDDLLQFGTHYDDLVQAKMILSEALQREDVVIDSMQETKASELENRLYTLMESFDDIIVQLDLSLEAEWSSLVSPALEAYRNGLEECDSYTGNVRILLQTWHHVQEHLKPTCLPVGEDLYLIMIGNTGHGKSSTGNTILERNLFKTGLSATPITQTSELKSETVGGRTIHLMDTPLPVAPTCSDIESAFKDFTHGCSAFLVVIDITNRFTEEQKRSVLALLKSNILDHTVLVFTHGNVLYEQQMKEGKMTFHDLAKTYDRALAELIDACQERCVLIDNEEGDPRKRRAQVYELIELVDTIKKPRYTMDMIYEQQSTENSIQLEKTDDIRIKRNNRCTLL